MAASTELLVASAVESLVALLACERWDWVGVAASAGGAHSPDVVARDWACAESDCAWDGWQLMSSSGSECDVESAAFVTRVVDMPVDAQWRRFQHRKWQHVEQVRVGGVEVVAAVVA